MNINEFIFTENNEQAYKIDESKMEDNDETSNAVENLLLTHEHNQSMDTSTNEFVETTVKPLFDIEAAVHTLFSNDEDNEPKSQAVLEYEKELNGIFYLLSIIIW